jgi:hypothetical protein
MIVVDTLLLKLRTKRRIDHFGPAILMPEAVSPQTVLLGLLDTITSIECDVLVNLSSYTD